MCLVSNTIDTRTAGVLNRDGNTGTRVGGGPSLEWNTVTVAGDPSLDWNTVMVAGDPSLEWNTVIAAGDPSLDWITAEVAAAGPEWNMIVEVGGL